MIKAEFSPESREILAAAGFVLAAPSGVWVSQSAEAWRKNSRDGFVEVSQSWSGQTLVAQTVCERGRFKGQGVSSPFLSPEEAARQAVEWSEMAASE